jgi:hypothetical protein
MRFRKLWLDAPPYTTLDRPSPNRARFLQNVWVLGTKIVLQKTVGYLGRIRSFLDAARNTFEFSGTNGNRCRANGYKLNQDSVSRQRQNIGRETRKELIVN